MANELKPVAVPVREACRIAGIGRSSLYKLMRVGALESIAIGRRRLILLASLEKVLANGANTEPA